MNERIEHTKKTYTLPSAFGKCVYYIKSVFTYSGRALKSYSLFTSNACYFFFILKYFENVTQQFVAFVSCFWCNFINCEITADLVMGHFRGSIQFCSILSHHSQGWLAYRYFNYIARLEIHIDHMIACRFCGRL